MRFDPLGHNLLTAIVNPSNQQVSLSAVSELLHVKMEENQSNPVSTPRSQFFTFLVSIDPRFSRFSGDALKFFFGLWPFLHPV